MKKREKFLCIFAIVVIIILVIVIINNIPNYKYIRELSGKTLYFNYAIGKDMEEDSLSEEEMNNFWHSLTLEENEESKGRNYYSEYLVLKQRAQNEADEIEKDIGAKNALVSSILHFKVYINWVNESEYYKGTEKIFGKSTTILISALAISLLIFFASEIKYKNIKDCLKKNMMVFVILLLLDILTSCLITDDFGFLKFEIDNFEIDWIIIYLLFLLINIQCNLKKSFKINIIITLLALIIKVIFSIIINGISLGNSLAWNIYYVFEIYIAVSLIYLISYGISVSAKKRREKIKDNQ